MKRLFKVMFLMIALMFSLQGIVAKADDGSLQKVQITVQNQVENPNGSSLIPAAGVGLSLYDLSQEYAQQKTTAKAEAFLESFAQMSASQVKTYLADNKITKLQSVTTAANGKAQFELAANQGAYLIVQDEIIDGQTIMPLAFALPLVNEDGSVQTSFELYAKPVKLTRAPYFYKYGVKDEVSAPLANAKFVLGKIVSGEKQYLTTTGTEFTASKTPATDANLKVFVSDENGLVLCDIGLTNGEYFFEEISAPTGYQISTEAKNVVVKVTDTQVSVNGIVLAELVAGMVPSSFTQAPKVLNYAVTTDKEDETSDSKKDPADSSSNTDNEVVSGAPGQSGNGGSTGGTTASSTNAKGDATDSSIGGMLAQLGEQKEWISLIGVLMVILAAMQLYKLKKVSKGSGSNEK
ncbi:pilin N-terminal domain-containing protein [Ligilactobacillus apodemi]|nr:SpaA isopeptide-forming pilin-related protein [Ligilactobacillus apodemi]